jgi:hypothetical protein
LAVIRDPSAAQVIARANHYLGYHEGHDNTGWNNLTRFGVEYGFNGVAWCQIFVWCVFHETGGESLVPKTASCLQAWDWYRTRGRTGSKPKVGALVYFGPGDHVGIVTRFDRSTITYVSGNTSDGHSGPGVANSVSQHVVSRSVPHGYAYPRYAPGGPRALRWITVQPGQTLGKIAAGAGITLASLLGINPALASHPNVIHPGDKVALPAITVTATPSSKPKPKPKPKPKASPTAVPTVICKR